MTIYTIETAKESLGFSAAHMTSFADGTFERLHGHNYRVQAALSGELDPAGMVMDVGTLKRLLRPLCDALDERVLLPLENPLVRVEASDEEVRVRCEERRYSLPPGDCALLPIANTTMEHLARYLAERLAERLRGEPGHERLTQLRVTVSESPGQSASWTLNLSDS